MSLVAMSTYTLGLSWRSRGAVRILGLWCEKLQIKDNCVSLIPDCSCEFYGLTPSKSSVRIKGNHPASVTPRYNRAPTKFGHCQQKCRKTELFLPFVISGGLWHPCCTLLAWANTQQGGGLWQWRVSA